MVQLETRNQQPATSNQTPINNIIVWNNIYYNIVVVYLFFEYIAGFDR